VTVAKQLHRIAASVPIPGRWIMDVETCLLGVVDREQMRFVVNLIASLTHPFFDRFENIFTGPTVPQKIIY
jgi:hypothetical protein